MERYRGGVESRLSPVKERTVVLAGSKAFMSSTCRTFSGFGAASVLDAYATGSAPFRQVTLGDFYRAVGERRSHLLCRGVSE